MIRLLLIPLLLTLVSCASLTEPKAETQRPIDKEALTFKSQMPEGNLHYYVEKLARQLFDTTNMFDTSRPIIVGTFLPAETLVVNDSDKLTSYGIQIQESLSTLLTQAGLYVVEYKALSKIKIRPNSDVMLSRDADELDSLVNADFMLTGTYVQRESSLIVNVRLINISNKKVVAAATDYIPINSMWNHSKISMRNQQLHRSEY